MVLESLLLNGPRLTDHVVDDLLTAVDFGLLRKLRLEKCQDQALLLRLAAERPLSLTDIEISGYHFDSSDATYLDTVLAACDRLERLMVTPREDAHEGPPAKVSGCSIHMHAATLRRLYLNDGLDELGGFWDDFPEQSWGGVAEEGLRVHGSAFSALGIPCTSCGASSRFERLEELAMTILAPSSTEWLNGGSFSELLVSFHHLKSRLLVHSGTNNAQRRLASLPKLTTLRLILYSLFVSDEADTRENGDMYHALDQTGLRAYGQEITNKVFQELHDRCPNLTVLCIELQSRLSEIKEETLTFLREERTDLDGKTKIVGRPIAVRRVKDHEPACSILEEPEMPEMFEQPHPMHDWPRWNKF
jgi:hypothetical protein